jgi:ribosomal protein L15
MMDGERSVELPLGEVSPSSLGRGVGQGSGQGMRGGRGEAGVARAKIGDHRRPCDAA